MMDKNNILKRNILHILLRYLLYCSNLMEFLSYSILVIFEIIVSRNIMTISRQDSADKRCSRNSLILRSTQLWAIVPWHFYLYTKLTVYHIRKYTFRPFILHIAIIVASRALDLFIAFLLSRNANCLTTILTVVLKWVVGGMVL